MADIITNFFLTPVANRIAGTQTKKLAPSLIQLGADILTRNPQREAVARLFSPASSASLIAGVESFLTAALAGQQTATAGSSSNPKSSAAINTPDASVFAQDLFGRTQTGAELRLKELLARP